MRNKDLHNKQIITRRTFIIGAGKLGLLFLLGCRMFYMQFIKKNDYKTLSDKNRIKILVINPTRGEILDRNNQLIAQNKSCFRLLVDKNNHNQISSEIKLISVILELDNEQISKIKKRIRVGGSRIPVVIIDRLDWRQISIIEERRPELKSIFIDTGFDRYYPMKHSSAHLLGYMGRPNQKRNNEQFFNKNFKVGKNGIERYYEQELRGEFGHKRIEINAHGKYVRKLKETASISGKNLKLNIDSDLQKQTTPLLNNKGCSAIVMDCTNGGVLICNSAPAYDPNKFINLSSEYWRSLINNPHRPLIDKTTKSLYPPGSVFKIITILAALESGIDPHSKVVCKGQAFLGGNKFRCASRRGHGAVNMINAIKYSCNTYIYDIAKQIGAEKIISVAKRFGFGTKTNIDLPGELSGFVPSPEWKYKKYKDKWRLGDTLNLSIGQGFLLATPIQLATMITTIASNGKLFTPQIAQSKPKYKQLDIKQEHLNIIKTALYHTINKPGGTGRLSKLNYKSIHMAGKTGTAQVQAKKNIDDNLSREDINWNSRNHAIFTGYAPFNNPKFCVSIYYDHGGGGGRSAAPIAKKIMEKVLKKYL